jgi:hypothetical protein
VQYPEELRPLPAYEKWIISTIFDAINDGEKIDKEIIQLSIPPTLKATTYRSIFAYGNHIHVKSAETHLVTMDSRVAAVFRTTCRSSVNDKNPVNVDVEYVGYVEEIMELNYGTTCVIVLLCHWVRANYRGVGATMECDEYGFTLVNFNHMLPISEDSFAFPIHIQHVFFSNDPGNNDGWKVVIKNEPRNRRVQCAKDKMAEVPCLTLGNDENCAGLANPTLGPCDVESDDSANEDDARQDINEDEFETEDNEDYIGISSSDEE